METKRIILPLEETHQGESSLLWQQAIAEGAALLRQGEVVAFPTETVYGLGANALDEAACAKIYKAKGRPGDNPLIVHVSSVEQAREMVRVWPLQAELCARAFWPGPLTLVLPKEDHIPSLVSGGLDTVAVRMPAHHVALAIIQQAGLPLAAPSANLSGKPSPTEGEHVWQDLQGRIPLLIEAGKSNVGLESTVLDLSGESPLILRPGGISREQLSAVLGEVQLDPGLQAGMAPKAPGMKYRHYAPKARIDILEGGLPEKKEQIHLLLQAMKAERPEDRIGLICLTETAEGIDQSDLDRVNLLFLLGSKDQPDKAASRLFEALRLCDQENIDRILAEDMGTEGVGLAYMNRLNKAAGRKK